jgi:hypothetical protein
MAKFLSAKGGHGLTDLYLKAVSEDLVPLGLARVPRRFTVCLLDREDRIWQAAGRGPDLELTFDVRNGRHECREVRVFSPDDAGREVKASDLSGIRIDDTLEMAMEYIFRGSTGDEASEIARGVEAKWAARDARASRKVKITDALLREVASVYRANVNGKPTEAVAAHFGRQHRTATQYIQKARKRGFLGPAIKGKAGEQ